MSKTRFLVLDLNGVLVQCVHSPKEPTVPHCRPSEEIYHGPPVYIKSKLVHLRPYLRQFLEVVQRRWWVIVWSSMTAENTNAIVEFIFKGLDHPCLVLAQEACRTLMTRDGGIVRKPNNPKSPQYLKVMKPIFWDQRPTLMNVPYTLKTTPGNTLMVDDSPAKTFLNPRGNVIICPSWSIEKVRDRFLSELATYLRALTNSSKPVNEYVRSNPIGESHLDPQGHLYRELFSHARFNKLV